MIPKIIHYCWFGRAQMPELALKCIESWHRYMPDYEYKLWNEDNFDVAIVSYTKEAYEAHKYAFVSDYVRLWALEREGGIYLDTDVVAFKSFDDLLVWKAFAGFEGSKTTPVGTCVMATEPHGIWVKEQLERYRQRHFVLEDGRWDQTTNVQFITKHMCENGLVLNGLEQDYKDLHIFPVEYFCPRQTTGEYCRTNNTHCDHLGMGSWTTKKSGLKSWFLRFMSPKTRIRLIKLKRKFIG